VPQRGQEPALVVDRHGAPSSTACGCTSTSGRSADGSNR
jgi:hypothetical protein